MWTNSVMSRNARIINLCKKAEHTDSQKISEFWSNKKTFKWFCNRAPSPLKEPGISAENKVGEEKIDTLLEKNGTRPEKNISDENFPLLSMEDPTYVPNDNESPLKNENDVFQNIQRSVPANIVEWLNSSDFENRPSPRNSEILDSLNLNENKTYTELISVAPPNISTNFEEKCSANKNAAYPSECIDSDFEGIQLLGSEKNKVRVGKHKMSQVVEPTVIHSPNIACQPTIIFSNAEAASSYVPETEDNSRDKDVDVNDCYSQTSTSSDGSNISNDSNNGCANSFGDKRNKQTTLKVESRNILSEQIKEKRNGEKKIIRCCFCDEDVISKNFVRHLQRHHGSEQLVVDILKCPKNSSDRRQAVALLRSNTNFELYISGTSRPYRKPAALLPENKQYYPCPWCKTVLQRSYLKRHKKFCISKRSNYNSDKDNTPNRIDHASHSQTVMACAIDTTDTISKLNVKKQVFDIMRGDEISFVAKKDLLIVNFGDSYLKKHRRERMAYACSNRMRELARLLISYRHVTNKTDVTFKELIHPKNFDNVTSAVRILVGYDPIKKTFKTPSLAMHLGTSLKLACEELAHLILKESKGFKCRTAADKQEWLTNVKNFKKLVESRWNIELASLAVKDLHEKRWSKPLLLPLVSDIKIFRDECLKWANDCEKKFLAQEDDQKTYKLLVNVTLALLIVFNRRRIGDVQYLKIGDYNNDQRSNIVDFEKALTETEKMLTSQYKRVMNSGKGSRAVVILIPKTIEKYIALLLENRNKYIQPDNEYVFATPGSKIKWGKGDVAIRTLANKMNLKHPHAISSNKLRKHIATVMQLISLTKDDEKQFSKFMGHTQKTHELFYELPVDLYQTAKVSKLLLLMEKGEIPTEYKGKSLTEINFDENLEFAIENENDDNADIILDDNVHHDAVNNHEEMDARTSGVHSTQIRGLRTEIVADSYISDNEGEKEKNCTKKPRISQPDVLNLHSLNDEENDSASEIVSCKKTTKKRNAWSTKDITALKTEFHSFIRRQIYPSGKEITVFLEKTKMNRSVAIVKSKLQHLMKNK